MFYSSSKSVDSICCFLKHASVCSVPCSGISRIEALQTHQNFEVYKAALAIIDKFFSEEVTLQLPCCQYGALSVNHNISKLNSNFMNQRAEQIRSSTCCWWQKALSPRTGLCEIMRCIFYTNKAMSKEFFLIMVLWDRKRMHRLGASFSLSIRLLESWLGGKKSLFSFGSSAPSQHDTHPQSKK